MKASAEHQEATKAVLKSGHCINCGNQLRKMTTEMYVKCGMCGIKYPDRLLSK